MPPPEADVAEYRSALVDVNTLAQRDLVRAWRTFDLDDAAAVRDGLMDTLIPIVDGYHLAAATVAADWYDLMRNDAGAPGRFAAVMPDQPNPSRAQVLARWGVGPLFSENPQPEVALSKISGGLQRVITDGARQTVVTSVRRDPARPGWVRIVSGSACRFCRMLAGRGAVYSQDSADFASHDACNCQAIPEF